VRDGTVKKGGEKGGPILKKKSLSMKVWEKKGDQELSSQEAKRNCTKKKKKKNHAFLWKRKRERKAGPAPRKEPGSDKKGSRGRERERGSSGNKTGGSVEGKKPQKNRAGVKKMKKKRPPSRKGEPFVEEGGIKGK